MPIIATIVIPCRNEEKYIAICLDSLEKQSFPKESMEVIVVDGMSKDGTRSIVAGYERRCPWVKMMDNPLMTTPCAFNIGIKAARGECIMIMGAHAEYPRDYISKCVAALKSSGADNVGGMLMVKTMADTLTAKAIVFSLSSLFKSRRLDESVNRPFIEVDTVFGGCYKKDVFKRVGMFNEGIVRHQDMEFNMRLKKSGGRILMFPDIKSCYYAKSSFKELAKHEFSDGMWVVYMIKFAKFPSKFRHYLPFLFILGAFSLAILSFIWWPFVVLLAILGAVYFAANLNFAARIAAREKNPAYIFLIPLAFTVRYFGFGLGSIMGVARLFIPPRRKIKY
ncbi:MAG: glycosyltransferase family 2 protein [Candidatus Pacebacteria bacterium]|jgi:glycosyltransferase involved in cell wall biosynthesis|nr:glycosyltransferase family 2 protein [Candidatus Paceibacterota bacterium]